MNAHLRVLLGDSVGKTIEVPQGKFVIGREADCHLQRDSAFISRHHCALLQDEYTLRIRDLGSKNGTFLNGRRIGPGETVLLDGDKLAVGEMIFEVDIVQPRQRMPLIASGSERVGEQTALENTGAFGDDTAHGRGSAISWRATLSDRHEQSAGPAENER
jgi:pSer/pThr/pTyr-binding forkhead associated (FHA) protein